jgi:diguanylate cyclase (GGDEF)-like protein/PAS domain S-box-containing protein
MTHSSPGWAGDGQAILAEVFATSPAAVLLTASDTRIIHANPAASALLGWPAKELVGRSVCDVVHPDDFALSDGRAQQMLAGELDSTVLERRYLRRDGAVVWGLVSISLVRPPTGDPYFLSTIQDISVRRAAEEEARRLRDQRELLLDAAADGICLVDPCGRAQFMNAAGLRLLGYRADELIGQDLHRLIHHSRPDGRPLPREECPVVGAISLGQSREGDDEVYFRADGTALPVAFTAVPVTEQGRPGGAVVTFRDLTRHLAAERASRSVTDRLAAVVAGQAAISAAGLDPERIVATAARQALGVAQADWAMVLLTADQDLVVRAAVGPVSGLEGRRLPFDPELRAALRATAVANGSSVRVQAGALSQLVAEAGGRAFIAAPIVHGDASLGLLVAAASGPDGFLARERSALELTAAAVAAGLADAQSYAQRQELLAQRTSALETLAVSEQRFRQAFRHAPIGMALLGLTGHDRGRILEANEALSRLTGHTPQALTELGLLGICHPKDRIAVHDQLLALASGQQEVVAVERRLQHAAGALAWIEGSIAAVVDAQDAPRYAILQVADATGRRKAEARLRRLALFDSLTGLANRDLLKDRLVHALAQAKRRGTLVALLFCDLDRFKVVNDTWGHDAGDQLLAAAAQRVQQSLRPGDTPARFGGDEFVVLCEDLTAPAEAEAVAERLRTVLAEPFALDAGEVATTVSIGICIARGGESPDNLMRNADVAMYEAKTRGRARYEVFSDVIGRRALHRADVEQQLRRALANDEFRLRYQPAFDVATGAVVGAEALLRWEHPELGLLAPEAFLDVAEESGLIVPIGEWVLHEACRQAVLWEEQADQAPTVWVNLSGRQAASRTLADLVGSALRASGLAPHRLYLELTETVLFEAAPSTRSDIAALKREGVCIGIDDFGTGYASMTYLTEFPVDFFKIDRTFVQGAADRPESAAIVETLTDLGGRLGLTVVAEGIETAAQLDWLAGLGIDVVQGFYLARPQPSEDVGALLRASAALQSGQERRRAASK